MKNHALVAIRPSSEQTQNATNNLPTPLRSSRTSIRAIGLAVSVALIGTVIFCAAYVAHSLTPVPHISDADRAALDALVKSVLADEVRS
jgi:hypothetical protein